MRLGLWDILLLAGVSIQATAIAYIYHPKWKALLYSVPIPFTLATLSLGTGIGVTNVTGLLLLLGYGHGVRLLHQRLGVSIVLSIVAAAVSYCGAATALVSVLPQTETAFWAACAIAMALGFVFFLAVPYRGEPGHRTPLPVWVKLPVVTLVILSLIAMKQMLQGFMTMFPMVGVVAAYEKRYSLWTFARQVPVLMMSCVPLMAVSRLTQPHVGLAGSLLLGWVVYLGTLFGTTRWLWARSQAEGIPEG